MLPRVSEQTPLLPENHSPSSSFSFAKIREYFIVALDTIILAPSFPTILALHVLEKKPELDSQDAFHAFIGLWVILAPIFSVLTALVGVFGPFMLLNGIIFLSCIWLRIFQVLYMFHSSRFVIRVVVFGTVLFSLWYVVDLRPEFIPKDLPPLSNSSSSIRVLDLSPAAERWEIKAGLRTVRLEDNPAFEALSYEWGDPRKSHWISVGGKRSSVTANLWKALHNIRHETETRTVWVDAISIDQTNLNEKSSQVPLMSLIYRRAKTVLISLGKHTPPHWVQKSDPSKWTSDWVEKMADEYWRTNTGRRRLIG